MKCTRRVLIVVVLATLLLALTASAAFGYSYLEWNQNSVPGSYLYSTWQYTLTSPLAPGVSVIWANQPIEISQWYIYDTATGTVNVSQRDYRFNGGAPVSLVDTFSVSAQGLYTFEATGTKNATTYHASRLFGIDYGRPTSFSDAVPVYDDAATITITATDTVSGASAIFYSLDNKPDYWVECDDPNVSSAVVTAGVGAHTLRWVAMDNAGNYESAWHTVSFAVNPDGFVPQLSKPLVKVSKHKVTFIGATAPLTTPATIKFVVQRKSGKHYKNYATYFANLKRYAFSYKFTKSVSASGSFQVKAYEGTGSSHGWVSFRVK